VNPWMPGWLTPLVATLATLGSMLALLAGVSRTAATMAEDAELPKLLAKRNRFGSPWVAELLIAAAAISVFVFNDYLQWIVGFSSFSVLLYYAIGHISVLRLPAAERKALTAVAVGGLALCAALLLSVPGPAVWLSSLILVSALAIRQVVSRLRAR
jgi:basic amino acid/polyamine antiporter, APA family